MMSNSNSNLRKAAVLLRSLDADTATKMLAQLSTEEAAAIREAIRSLGSINPDEQADVLDDFRRARPHSNVKVSGGVELAFSETIGRELPAEYEPSRGTINRFEFLRDAPTSALVPYLSREHSQTIAVVLSHLQPARAAEVLGALPAKLQADTMERLEGLGDTDPESVSVLEQELSTWFAKRGESRSDKSIRGGAMSAILLAADAKTRDGIMTNLKSQKAELADRIAPMRRDNSGATMHHLDSSARSTANRQTGYATAARALRTPIMLKPTATRQVSPPAPAMDFDHLVHLDDRALASVLREMDANVLALALVGSQDELVDRICDQMPKRIARDFRRQLRRIGPTRLSDVEGAQRAVAAFASQQLARRRRTAAASA